MPCDQSSIWPQIIGPVSALTGVLIGLLFSVIRAKTEREHQRKILLRGKYEDLALSLSDSVSDVQALLTANTNLELFLRARPALAQKIDILARLYFSELKDLADDYLCSVVSLQNSLSENYDPNSNLNVGEQGAKSEIVKEAQDKLMIAKHALDEAIDKYSNKYATS